MIVNHNIIDYMVRSCVNTYNLGEARLIKQNLEEKKVQFAFKRSDLKLSVEFANDKISSIIYNNFLTDHQRENVTEQEFISRMNEMLEIKTIESVEEIEKISKDIIKSINSSKLFGGKIRELLLNSEDREYVVKIKRFFGPEKQSEEFYKSLNTIEADYIKYRKSFYKDDLMLIKSIASSFVNALQIGKTKILKHYIKGLVDNSKLFSTERIEKIIKEVKRILKTTSNGIDDGLYGNYKIEYKQKEKKSEPKEETKTEEKPVEPVDVFETAENKKIEKEEKEKAKKENKIIKFIKENQPYYYLARDIQLRTDIKAKECTQIVTGLIEAGKITVTKDGKQGIYGATLILKDDGIENAEVVY